MRKQQAIWQSEHDHETTIPGMADVEPASGVVRFVAYLQEIGITPPATVIDIGCGKGRNSIFMASKGFNVQALDYIQSALDTAVQLAEHRKVLDKITFKRAEIDKPWDFPDDFFELAIDSYSSIDIETKEGRDVYVQELYRTLKPGGFALVTVVSADDEWEKQLIAASPGAEPNSTIWPQSGKFQKDYTESELRGFYKDFKIEQLQKLSKPGFKLGKHYQSTNFWAVLRKAV